ncbi:LysR family transcriptional regulator [Sphingomonas sp. IC081]|uniref:LysR family transcriptional regulator n=1 Tax=Sphingomonas sp. IC081 TaxID=304378 RepID=UPI0011595032|nr:LysR family transcriptional regulator [Sphingomonas sp. IC081]QDK35683.1 LysR family transcriptional regulator [Sphingomonas sp. IC081]
MFAWAGLEEFVAIADSGSFVAAARALGVSTSHVSRAVSGLEHRLSTQLFVRTTRKVALTEEGRALADQLRRILQERDEALASLGAGSAIAGELRVTCSTALGERFVAPLARRFAVDHPQIRLRLELSNRIVDIVGEGFDIAVRTGGVADTRLVARRIGSRRLIMCASPDYLQRTGVPLSIDDLTTHECLVGARDRWIFEVEGATRIFTPRGRWNCNSGTALADAALDGLGLCQIPLFYVADHLRAGRLVSVLESLQGSDEPIWALASPRRAFMPRVRRFTHLLERELPHLIASH